MIVASVPETKELFKLTSTFEVYCISLFHRSAFAIYFEKFTVMSFVIFVELLPKSLYFEMYVRGSGRIVRFSNI